MFQIDPKQKQNAIREIVKQNRSQIYLNPK